MSFITQPSVIALILGVFSMACMLILTVKKIVEKPSLKVQLEYKLFELNATQLVSFQKLIGDIIYQHKTVLANQLSQAAKHFLEDINAAVELNNQKKEQQIKTDFLALIARTEQQVSSDELALALAIKQHALFASAQMQAVIDQTHEKIQKLIEHTHSYLKHLHSVAESPFDSRLHQQLALSEQERCELMALIDLLNKQFDKEKRALAGTFKFG